MIKKTYICASCGQKFALEVFERNEPIPVNVSTAAPKCECGSTALINPEDIK